MKTEGRRRRSNIEYGRNPGGSGGLGFGGGGGGGGGRNNGLLVSGDIEEALRATKAIGDDRLQKMSQGFVRPDMFTHGTSEQRNIWFRKGYEAGDLSAWDTFSLPESELG